MSIFAIVTFLVLLLALIAMTLFLVKIKISTASARKLSKNCENELKRQQLELKILRLLGERIGYSLDLGQILETVISSLEGLLEYTAVSYIQLKADGRVAIKIHSRDPLSQNYLDGLHQILTESFSTATNQSFPRNLIEETLDCTIDDNQTLKIGSYFNLPATLNGKTVALINISSVENGLYENGEAVELYQLMNRLSSQASKLLAALEKEKRKLSSMVGSLEDGIVLVDPLFNLVVANQAVFRLLGLIESKDLFEILTALSGKAEVKGAIEQAIGSGQVIKLPEFKFNNQTIQIDVEPVKDEFGYLLGATVVLHDLTRQKELEKLKEEFTAMMIHELRTPLTTTIYSMDMLLNSPQPVSADLTRQTLVAVKDTITEMLSLITELLDIAKFEAGKFTITKGSHDLNQLIQEKVNFFQPVAKQKNLQIIQNLDSKITPFAFDDKRVGQVLDNLFSNALKYTDQGQITVKTILQNQQVQVSVQDSGEGIKPEDLDKLFSKFSQTGKGKTGEKVGTGLGLVVAKSIVEAHHGQIWAASEGVGQGATFSFTLPLGI